MIFGATMLMAAALAAAPTPTPGGDMIRNVLQMAPYTDPGPGRLKLVDQPYLLMMQAALKPGQMVHQHNADSNVHLLILDGEVVINLAGKDVPAKKGDLVPVAPGMSMNIQNRSAANATFLIIKTPHPRELGKTSSVL
jgi:quercetin dioxygenase-like cupin family protein